MSGKISGIRVWRNPEGRISEVPLYTCPPTKNTAERDALLAEIKKVVDYGVSNGWYEVDSLLIKIRKHLTEESK
jgi:hypothetical protein